MTAEKCTMFLQKWILNLQDLPRSQSPETVPACIVFASITHTAILFALTCVMNVRYQSIQALVTSFGPFCYGIVRTCLLTIIYQVVQFLPNINISEQFESMYMTILQQILFLLL